jgi:hypothetical protein
VKTYVIEPTTWQVRSIVNVPEGGRAIVTFFAVAQFPKLSIPSEEMPMGQERP